MCTLTKGAQYVVMADGSVVEPETGAQLERNDIPRDDAFVSRVLAWFCPEGRYTGPVQTGGYEPTFDIVR